jgi:hypothetical protein
MQDQLKKHFIKQIDDVLNYQSHMRAGARYDDLSGLNNWEYDRIITMALAAIDQIVGSDSIYARQAMDAAREKVFSGHFSAYKTVIGILASLREALVNDYLDKTAELIHASVFADFLEMASYLLDEGYKDPAAVIAGSSLEAHLKQLCLKHGIDPVEVTGSGDARPKKADRMNSDLAKAKVYSILDQKNVTAWLDLRNKAAHGEYDKYVSEQVRLLIAGVQDFLTRNAA